MDQETLKRALQAQKSYSVMSDQIIFIKDAVLPLLRPYVSRISVFGSYARGEAMPESDVDLLVKLRPPKERPVLGLKWFLLEKELSERIGRRVEMVTEEAVSSYIRPFIEKDCVIIYEG